MGYTSSALKGVGWISFFRIITRALTFVRLAILGRVLTPIEFGYFGIASLFLTLLEILTETGINIVLVQHKGKIDEFLNSAFVVSILRGTILSILILILAPFVASFFNSKESVNIISLIALVPFIRGLINPSIVNYQKELQFGKEFRLRTLLFVVDVIISVIVGVYTRSAIGFVYGQIASALVEVLLSYILFVDKPKIAFEAEKIKHIVKRGFWVTLTGIFSYFSDNGDNIAVGRILGSANLGIYQVAYRLSTLSISEITMVVNQVIFPVYTKISDDKKRLQKAFIKVTAFNWFIGSILGIFIFVFAEQIILIIMGEQWVSAVPAVKILAIYGIFRTAFGNFSALFLALNRQDYVAKMTFVRFLTVAILIVPFINYFGMVGAGYTMLTSIIIEIPIILIFTLRAFK